MGKHAQIIMGPAGSGKSTYTNVMRIHCENTRRLVHCVNLDPAAEDIAYPVSIDIRDLVTVDEVMEELDYGPNGGLVYSMNYLMQNIEWFEEQLGDYEDDYLLIDCPGQTELYTHIDIMHNFCKKLQQLDYQVCAVYILDAHFIVDSSKFLAGTLMCLSAMVRLNLPHINVMSKLDLLPEAEQEEMMDRFLNPDVPSLIHDLNQTTSKQFHKLNQAFGSLIEDYNLVQFVPLNIKDEDSIAVVLAQADNAIQYGEDVEPRDKDWDEEEEAFEEETDLSNYAF